MSSRWSGVRLGLSRIMGYCIITPHAIDSADDSAGADPGHRHTGTRRPRAGHRAEPARTSATHSTWRCSPTCPARTACWSPMTPCARVSFSRTATTSRRPRPRRCRTEHRERRGAVPGRRARSVAAGWHVDQARRRRGTRLVHDARHRVASCRRHPRRGRRHPVFADGGASRDLSVRRCHRPAAAADRMGQRDAVAAHRRRVRRRGGQADRAAPGDRRRRSAGTGHRPRYRAHHRGPCRPTRCPCGVGVGTSGPHRRRRCRDRTATAGDDATLRQRRRRRGCAVVHRATRSPVPGLARTGYARRSRCRRASHGPLQEQCARSRVQPFRGARAREGVGNR